MYNEFKGSPELGIHIDEVQEPIIMRQPRNRYHQLNMVLGISGYLIG
jgi:hypothetical protein